MTGDLWLFIFSFSASIGHARQAAPLRWIQAIPVPHAHGRIDGYDLDVAARLARPLDSIGEVRIGIFYPDDLMPLIHARQLKARCP